MKNIYNLILGIVLTICCTACNKEWEDEQYLSMASFKANVNAQGVTTTYVRFKPGGVVKYNLPVIMSGSTMSNRSHTIHVGLDVDTLKRLNVEQYGHREELYFQQLPDKYYNIPETVEMPAGECVTTFPVEFKLDETLDQSDKWVLPLQILDDSSFDYQINPRKYYRRAMLRLLPFNDYSGTYDAAQYRIFLEPDKTNAFTVASHRAFVVDDRTIFVYAGTRDIDFLDRKLYKVFIRFPKKDSDSKLLEVWSDNDNIEFKLDNQKACTFTMNEEMDELKPYLRKIYITLYLYYSFVDYTTIPGKKLEYRVEGSLAMQRNMNTLIPDEDQQIQW